MNFNFRHESNRAQRDASKPIFCTQRFTKDIERIYGNISRNDDEASAYAHVIAGSAIFYKCEALPDYMMQRQRAHVSTRMDTPEVRKMFIDELKLTKGRNRHVSVHDHPMNFPYLSGCDVRTYEHCRTSETEPSPLGYNKPYPVVLINLPDNGKLELVGFWVNDGYAHRTTIEIIPDESEIVRDAWKKAPPLAYFSREAELARNIDGTLPHGWSVVLGEDPSTNQKALLVTAPDGRNKAIPFSNSPMGLEYDDLWMYVDWLQLFVNCFNNVKGTKTSAQEPTEQPTATTKSTEQPTAATESTEQPTVATESTEQPTVATESTEQPTAATESTEQPTAATEPTEQITTTEPHQTITNSKGESDENDDHDNSRTSEE